MKSIAIAILIISCSLNEQARERLFEAVRCSDLMGITNHERSAEMTDPVPAESGNSNKSDSAVFRYADFSCKIRHGVLDLRRRVQQMDLLGGDIMLKESLLIDLEAETPTGRKQVFFFRKNPGQRERISEGTSHRDDAVFRSHGNLNHERLAETSSPCESRVTTGDNIGGDALIDKISDLYLLQTDAAKKTLDYQVAGSKNGAIAVVLSAVTGANGTVTCSVLRSTGGTFGSYKVKDGARIQFINGTTNVARGAPTTGVVVDPGGNNRATSVITFDTVPAGTTAGDYLTYEGSALKAPHGLTDLINNDTQSRVRSLATMNRKLPLIDLEAEMPTGRKGSSSGRIQRERLNEEASLRGDDAIVWACGNRNRKRLAETTSPVPKGASNKQGEIQGQLRSNRPYLKSIVLNAATQRLQVALLVEVHFSLRYRTDNPGNTLILSSPTQKAAYMSNGFVKEARRAVTLGCYGVNSGEAYSESHGNPEPSRTNGLRVVRKVQRSEGEDAKPIHLQQRPALALAA